MSATKTAIKDYLKSNTFLAFVDSLLPYLRLELTVVKDALVIYNLKVSSRTQYGDTLHLAAGSVDDIIQYFPGNEKVLQPLVYKLSAFPFGAKKRTVQFLDVLIILTLLTKGTLREKARLLYSFFALAEPEGMLEYEHAGLILKVGTCLKKIDAIRPLDLTADDSRYLADLARRNDEEGGYHKSLNFANFFKWITNSPETSPAFQFIRLVNRLLHVARTLDAKSNAVASMLRDITEPPDTSIGVPKFSSNNLLLQDHIPQIVFCNCNSVSLLLPSSKAYYTDVYVHIEKMQLAPYPLFEFTSKALAKRNNNSVDREPCCTKTYHIVSRQHVYSPAFPHASCLRQNQVDIPSFQVTVSRLTPGTDYFLTLYTADLRFPSVKMRTPDVAPMLPQDDAKVKLVIFPASMDVDETVAMAKNPNAKHLQSHSLQMVFTGAMCPLQEAASQIMNSALCFPLQPLPQSSREASMQYSAGSLPPCLPEHFATVASGVVDNYYSCHWHANETKLFSLANTSVSVEGLTNEASCLRNMMTFPCSHWESSQLESRLKVRLPPAYFSKVDETLSHKYFRHAAASSPPTCTWEMGFTKVFFIQSACVHVPTTQTGGQVHASFLPTIVDNYTQNVLSNKCNHLILLLRSPEDLMKHSSLWGEEDSQLGKKQIPEAENDEKFKNTTTVRRGKHEILYGAHSDAPDTAAQKMFATANTIKNKTAEFEVRTGGDALFNTVIRSLYRWLTAAPVGARRVTLVSCRWTSGMDFSLCLDGDSANFISHVSLEPTGMNPQCTAIINRIKQSFPDTVSVETGPLNSTSRVVVFDVVCSDGSPAACQFEEVSRPKAKLMQTIPLLRQPLVINGIPKIVYLSSDEVCIELDTSGCGYVSCCLYEVPCMVGYADVHRIIETELSSLYILQKISNRFIGNHVKSKFTFRDLAAFCAYCIIVTTSESDPTSHQDTEPLLPKGGVLSTPPFVHFRTLNKPDNTVSTCLLAGVLDGDLTCASATSVRIKEQLDGNGRPLAALVYLCHNRLDRQPSAVESKDHYKLRQCPHYSEEVRDLFRMTMTVHIGDKEMLFSNGQIDFEARSFYEQQNGSIHFSSNGKFARIALTMDTAKAFHDLANCVDSIRRMKNIMNMTVFVTKPLMHHMENKIVGSRNWEKSKHYDKKDYFPALIKALSALTQWKQEQSGRDIQIITVANVSCTLVTYFHSPGKKHPPETGFRHFTLPLYIHQDDDTETFAIPCGTFKLDSKHCYTTYTFNKGVRKSDLRNGTPFQLLQPHFHLHGYPNPAYAQIVQNVLYKVSVFTDDEADLSDQGRRVKVTHNHVTIKTILDDIDNMELLLGPVVGQVTSTTVNIVFEVNRQADSLVCALRPVSNPSKLKEIKHRAMPFQPVVYQFEELETDQVYEILMPEIYGQTVIGKFRSLSSKAYFSEIMFLGDEHLENFPIATKVIDEMLTQQVINFEQLRAISYVRKYEKDSREAAGVDATLDKDDPAYRRPWICLSERMKSLACTTSTVFHLGSHALLSRLLRHIIPPLVKTVKKYNIDLEKYEKSSAVSKFYQMQLNQIIEDSLRLVWIVEPVLKDVFCNSSNIPLYNSEYWLSESKVWGTELDMNFTDRDIVALEKVRKLFTKNLEKFIYPLKSWRKKAKNHFHVWKEGTVTVITLDQTSEQAKRTNNRVVGAANTALGRIEEDEDDDEEEEKALPSKGKKKKKGKEVTVEEETKAKTYDASFMSEHQWKQIRTILMEKETKQLVLCMQFPMIPLELADEVTDDASESQTKSEYGNNLTWAPREEDIIKFFGQMLKWIMPKKGKRSGKTLSFVCVSNKSYMTNIQDMKSGMKIQQMCLGKFSCVKESFGKDEAIPEVSSSGKYKLSGKLGTWKFQHRLEGLDEVTLNSDYCGNGGVYTGRAVLNHEPYSAVYGLMRFWFDSWKPTGVWNFNKIRAIGPPEEVSGDAIMLVGPIIGAPSTQYVEDNKAATTMTVPFLFELDRHVTVTCVATDLFNGTQVVITQEIFKHRPTVLRLANLNIDTRYTVDFIEGVQNAYSSRFVVQTHCNWDDTNIMIFNMEQRGAQNPTTNDSSYIKSMSDRLRLPFHGVTCALHVNCHVDLTAIFDEVEFMPALKDLLAKVKESKIDAVTRAEIISHLKKLVGKIMDRVRLEYRLYFSRPSYRDLLIRGFHLFMGRETYKEADSTETTPSGSLMALLHLIASRVNQEYFDQLIASEEEVYSAWPRIEYTEEMRRQMKEKEDLKREAEEDLEEDEEPLIDPNNPDGFRLLTVDDYLDKHILNVPLMRRPFRTFFDNAQNPVDCVLFQWMQNFVPPPVLWKPYVSPNQKVTIESFCTCDDRHIRDIHERIVNSDIHQGARLIVMPSFGPLMHPQSLLGYKMSQWTRRWIKEGVDRTITLVAPSKAYEGTHNYTMSYGAWPDQYQYARTPQQDIPPPLEGNLNIQTLHSIYMSNEKEIAQIKKEKVDAIKEKTKTTSKSRGALEKKKKDEAALKEILKVELQEIFQSLTPDGFAIFENRTGHVQDRYGSDMTISYTEMKTVGTKLDKSLSAEGTVDNTPKPHDYLHLPLWVQKFVPATAGVFVQDEVNLIIRQEPHSRKALDIIETDENIVRNCKKIYLSSRLSELSRPEDLREYDMDVDGIKEMFLEEIVARIWREALPPEVKGRLFTLTDDFIRAICVRRAFTDIDRDLSSPLNFCKAARRLLLANAQMFLAFKMSKMERWKYIMETDEFPEDHDRPYNSDDEDSDVETKDDETELTTKDDEETETKMSESIAELPSYVDESLQGGSVELQSINEEGGEKKVGGGDTSTVEGLFDRTFDNVSNAPIEEGDETKEKEGIDESGEEKILIKKMDDEGVDQQAGDQTELVPDEEKKDEKEEDKKEEVEEKVDVTTTPPEDLPPSESETLALQQVDHLYNLNWRRLEKKRDIGEKLSYMSTNFLS